MQALVDLFAGLVALLLSAALSQFGVDLHAGRNADREVHRVRDCGPAASPSSSTTPPAPASRDC